MARIRLLQEYGGYGREASPKEILDQWRGQNVVNITFWCEEGGDVVATASLGLLRQYIPGFLTNVVFFGDAVVDPEYRRRGLYKGLLEARFEYLESGQMATQLNNERIQGRSGRVEDLIIVTETTHPHLVRTFQRTAYERGYATTEQAMKVLHPQDILMFDGTGEWIGQSAKPVADESGRMVREAREFSLGNQDRSTVQAIALAAGMQIAQGQFQSSNGTLLDYLREYHPELVRVDTDEEGNEIVIRRMAVQRM